MTGHEPRSQRRPLADLERDVRCRNCGRTFSGTAGEVFCSEACSITPTPHTPALAEPRVNSAAAATRERFVRDLLDGIGGPDVEELEWLCGDCGRRFRSRRGGPRCPDCKQRFDRAGAEWTGLHG